MTVDGSDDGHILDHIPAFEFDDGLNSGFSTYAEVRDGALWLTWWWQVRADADAEWRDDSVSVEIPPERMIEIGRQLIETAGSFGGPEVLVKAGIRLPGRHRRSGRSHP